MRIERDGLDHWKSKILEKTSFERSGVDSNIYTGKMTKNLGIEFHEKMTKGAALRELKEQHLHLSYWETPYYASAIKKFVKSVVEVPGIVALDVGCGDGRFTELLLEMGCRKIIAADAHMTPLISLSHYAKEKGVEDSLLLLHCSADHLELPDSCVDLVLAIGVLYYLNESYEKGLNEAARVLKSGGLLINSEPDLEGAIYKSMFFEDIDDVIENLKERQFKEEKGKTDFKFRLFTPDDIKKMLIKYNFEVLDFHGLSLLPSILRIKMVREEINRDEVAQRELEIRNIFDYLDRHGSLYKHIIWKSRKLI